MINDEELKSSVLENSEGYSVELRSSTNSGTIELIGSEMKVKDLLLPNESVASTSTVPALRNGKPPAGGEASPLNDGDDVGSKPPVCVSEANRKDCDEVDCAADNSAGEGDTDSMVDVNDVLDNGSVVGNSVDEEVVNEESLDSPALQGLDSPDFTHGRVVQPRSDVRSLDYDDSDDTSVERSNLEWGSISKSKMFSSNMELASCRTIVDIPERDDSSSEDEVQEKENDGERKYSFDSVISQRNEQTAKDQNNSVMSPSNVVKREHHKRRVSSEAVSGKTGVPVIVTSRDSSSSSLDGPDHSSSYPDLRASTNFTNTANHGTDSGTPRSSNIRPSSADKKRNRQSAADMTFVMPSPLLSAADIIAMKRRSMINLDRIDERTMLNTSSPRPRSSTAVNAIPLSGRGEMTGNNSRLTISSGKPPTGSSFLGKSKPVVQSTTSPNIVVVLGQEVKMRPKSTTAAAVTTAAATITTTSAKRVNSFRKSLIKFVAFIFA